MYCRFENDVHPREPLSDLLLATCDHSSSLEDHVKLLQKVGKILQIKMDFICLNENSILQKRFLSYREFLH